MKVLLKVLDNFTMEDAINCMQVRCGFSVEALPFETVYSQVLTLAFALCRQYAWQTCTLECETDIGQ